MKKKTTVYLDSDVLTATKAAALTSHRSESAVVEDALRSYLRSGHGDVARDELRALLERLTVTSDLDEEAALELAVDEVRAVRHERRPRSARGG
jgi:Arc/MetJ family transcription regulator